MKKSISMEAGLKILTVLGVVGGVGWSFVDAAWSANAQIENNKRGVSVIGTHVEDLQSDQKDIRDDITHLEKSDIKQAIQFENLNEKVDGLLNGQSTTNMLIRDLINVIEGQGD